MPRRVELRIAGDTVQKSRSRAGVQGEGNVTDLVCSFDASWDGFAKTLTFWDAEIANPVKLLLTEAVRTGEREYTVKIPAEPLAKPGKCVVTVDGYTGAVRARTLAAEFLVDASPVTDSAQEPVDPTPTQAEQLQIAVDAAKDIAQSVRDDADAGKFNGEPGYTPARGKDYWTKEDVARMDNYEAEAKRSALAAAQSAEKAAAAAERAEAADEVFIAVAYSTYYSEIREAAWGGKIVFCQFPTDAASCFLPLAGHHDHEPHYWAFSGVVGGVVYEARCDVDDNWILLEKPYATMEAVEGAAEILSLRTPVEKSHTITDSAELPPEDLHIYGESSQSGTPAPDAPVEIVSTEAPVITVENGAGEMQTVTLSGITLRGLKDADGNWAARDEIAVGKGSVTLIRRTKEYVFTGEEAISFNLQLSDGRCQYYTYSVNGGTGDRSAGISTHCVYGHGAAYLGQQIGIFVNEKITWLVWNKSKSEIKADLQAKYAAGAPLTVVYPLATPIITDITDTEAGQALLALHTCYPTTRVLCDADCSLTYKADITNAFAKLTHADGKTPVRGTDYWTDADIAEIKSYVDDAILGGAW